MGRRAWAMWWVGGLVGLALGACAEAAARSAAWPDGVAEVAVDAPALAGRGGIFTATVTVRLDQGWTATTSAAIAPRAPQDVRLFAPIVSAQDAQLTIEQPLAAEREGSLALGLRITTTLCRSDRCFVRTLDVSPLIEVVDGTPRDVVARLVARRLALGAGPLRQCFYGAIPDAPSAFSAAANASANGDGVGLTLVRSDPQSEQLVACARDLMSDVAFSTEVEGVPVTLSVARERSAPIGRGRVGDICAVGERQAREQPWLEVPKVSACQAGLRCCGGGAWGSSSQCMRVAQCPMLP